MIKGNRVFFLLYLLIFPIIGLCQTTPSVPKWVTDFGSAGGSAITSASRSDSQNNIYITGPFFGTVDFDPSAQTKNLTAVGNADIFLAKYDVNGALVWAVGMGGSNIDQGNGIAIDLNGNVTVVGQFYSPFFDADPGPGTSILNSSGNADMFVISFDKNGNFIWGKKIGAGGADFLNKVAIDKAGNIILGGQFQGAISFGNQSVTAGASVSALVAKLDQTGNFVWGFSLGQGSTTNLITGASCDSKDGIVVSGVFSGTVNFNPLGTARNITVMGGTASFVARYTSSGQLSWVRYVEGAISASNLCLDSFDNVYTVSPSTSSLIFDNGFNLPSQGNRFVALAKYLPDGTFQWAKGIGGADATIVNYEVAASTDNNIYFSGFFEGTVDFDPSVNLAQLSDHGIRDIFLAKYDVSGNYQWAISTGNNSCTENIGRTVTVDKNNDVILGGAFCSTVNFDVTGCSTLNVTAKSGNRDGFLAKYTPAETGLSNNVIVAPAVTGFCGPFDPVVIQGSTPTGGTGLYTYQWQSSVDGVIFTDIVGATGKDFDPPVISNATSYRRMVGSGTCNIAISSNIVQFTEQNTLSNNTVALPVVTEFCAGKAIDLLIGSLPTGGTGTYTYQWQNSTDGFAFTDIVGATGKDYDPGVISFTTYFRRKVSPGSCEVISNIIKISILPPVTNNITAPGVILFCGTGDAGTITGSTSTGGNGSYTYQWQLSTDGANFSDINGAIGIDYDPQVINTTTYYRRKVTSGTCDALSNIVQIIIEPALANNVLNQPSVTAFCGNLDPDVITGTTPTGGNGTYTYQWQSSADGTSFTNIATATSANFDPQVITSVIYFRRIVSSGACGVSTSNVIQFTTTPPLANNQITASPNVDFCGNGDPDILRGSSPSGGNGTYNYQWQSSINGVSFANITGAVSSDYDPSVINTTTYYRRKIFSGSCELISNVIKMTVQPVLSTNTITAQAPIVFCGSGDAGVITGSVPPGGFTYYYQWQSSTDGISFTDLLGANAINYDPPVVTETIYYRRLINSSVCVVPLISNIVIISVDPPLANNSITPPGITSFCNTGNPSTIVGSIPTGGSGTFNFQWQLSTNGVIFSDIVGAVQSNFNPPIINSTVYYRRLVTSGNCTVPNFSNVIKITIDPLVNNNTIDAPPITSFCGDGQPGAIIGSTPVGGNGIYNYQWESSVDNVTFTNIQAATQKDYTPGILSTSVYYRRVVTSGSCNTPTISNFVFLQIVPLIQNNNITPPAVTEFCSSGDPDAISGSLPNGGTGTYLYQWQRSADNVTFTNIPGETSKDYDPPLLNSTIYYRRAVISGVCNMPLFSNTIVVNVSLQPVITLDPEVTICAGTSIILNPAGGNGSFNYSWSPAQGLSSTNTASPVASPMVNTSYTLTVTNGTCVSISTVIVKVIPKPEVSAGPDKQILKGSSVILNATATGEDLQYSWTPALYLDNPNIAQPTASPTEDITYTLTVTSPNNCFTINDEVFIKVYPQIKPPSAFTPNNDGINDVWEIPALTSYNNTTVSVYNRNGELLYQSVNYAKAWDGTYKGKLVPFGTYYYIIDIKDKNAVASKLSGSVAVIR